MKLNITLEKPKFEPEQTAYYAGRFHTFGKTVRSPGTYYTFLIKVRVCEVIYQTVFGPKSKDNPSTWHDYNVIPIYENINLWNASKLWYDRILKDSKLHKPLTDKKLIKYYKEIYKKWKSTGYSKYFDLADYAYLLKVRETELYPTLAKAKQVVEKAKKDKYHLFDDDQFINLPIWQ